MPIATRAALITVLVLAGGCAIARSGLANGQQSDAGPDGGSGGDGSVGGDRGLGGVDAGTRDGGRDGGVDGGRDGGFEGDRDAGIRDAGIDAGRDAAPDPCTGPCTPAEIETRSCGPCGNGTEARTCTASCTWGGWGACVDHVSCARGSTVRCPGESLGAWQCCGDGEWRMGGC